MCIMHFLKLPERLLNEGRNSAGPVFSWPHTGLLEVQRSKRITWAGVPFKKVDFPKLNMCIVRCLEHRLDNDIFNRMPVRINMTDMSSSDPWHSGKRWMKDPRCNLRTQKRLKLPRPICKWMSPRFSWKCCSLPASVLTESHSLWLFICLACQRVFKRSYVIILIICLSLCWNHLGFEFCECVSNQ